MFFLLCSMLLQDEIVALAAAAIFALHPIHSEVVNWVAAVTELEMSLFCLASFIFFLRRGSETAQNKTLATILMCLSFVLALLSKEQAVMMAVLATIYEHFYRSDRETTRWKEKVWRYGGFWIAAGLYLTFRATVLGGLAPVRQHIDVTWPQAFLSAFALVWQYMAKLFWPQPLLAFYVFHKSSAIGDPRVLAGIAIVALSVALFIYLWKQARSYSFALIWMALTLAPVLNARWMATNVFTERYLYLPSVGFCALVAGAFVFVFRRFCGKVLLRWALAAAAIVVCVLAARQITARNRDWHDDFTFLSNTLAVEPHASYLRSDFGVLEWNRGHAEEAERQWRLAIADKPDNVIALSNLGMAMLERKDYPGAESFLEQAIALRPHFAEPHIHLAGVYAARGDQVRAEEELRRAVEIYPLSTQARNALGKLYFNAGKLAEAEVQYRASVDSLPNPEGWNGLGDIYIRHGAAEKAEAAWREVLRLSTYDTHAHRSLGNIYFASGREAEAEKEYRIVLLFDPHDADALRAMRKLHPSEFPASMR
jgi:tetratricopeptide (TPR) repeat protein